MDAGQCTGNTAGVDIEAVEWSQQPEAPPSGLFIVCVCKNAGNNWRVVYYSEVKAE